MDLYNLVVSAKLTKGGGGGDIDVDALNVTENGTYSASSGHAYSPVTVDVPNSYDASDEGKVVSNGALVGQTSATKTANGTYDTTLNDEIVVNVPSVTPTGNINITSTAQTDVSAYATAQVVDADLVASNIKKDVDILGVVGTYEGGGGGSADLAGVADGSITQMVIPDGVTNLREFAFKSCTALENVVFPNSLIVINQEAFCNCHSLEKVVLGINIDKIWNEAFRYTSLTEVEILSENVSDITNAFKTLYNGATISKFTIHSLRVPSLAYYGINMANDGKIYVPASVVNNYKSASNWSAYASQIEAIPE